MNRTSLVITSIGLPNKALAELADGCRGNNIEFILVGDEASPADFRLDGCDYYDIERQRATGFAYARACPTRSYARKNIGYLIAARNGSEIIIETDDDNHPREEFWSERKRQRSSRLVEVRGWVNVYRYFIDAQIWPRGLPLDKIRETGPAYDELGRRDIDSPIQQGLADGDPDVDAIYRLTGELPVSFEQDPEVALASGCWSPFNSQNTTWWRDAFPLMYLPAYCSMRMTDMWRGFVAQRIAWTNGWNVLFHGPTVLQERNEHDLTRDLADEVPGYLHNSSLCEELDKLNLPSGVANIGNNLLSCYEKLVSLNLVKSQELDLLSDWIRDIKTSH